MSTKISGRLSELSLLHTRGNQFLLYSLHCSFPSAGARSGLSQVKNQQASPLALSGIDKLPQKSIQNSSMCCYTTGSPVNNPSCLFSFYMAAHLCPTASCFPCKPKTIPTSFKMSVRQNSMKPCRFIREVKGKGQTLQHGNKHPLICNSCTWAPAPPERFLKIAIPHRTAKKNILATEAALINPSGSSAWEDLMFTFSKFAAGDKTCGISCSNFQCVATAAWWWWWLWLECRLQKCILGI